MTTDPHDEHGDILRRALHAEADSVMPTADGLEKIRARVEAKRRRRFTWAWFTETWARPVLAVSAAVFIAAVGAVAGPSTFGLITSSGNHGKVDQSQHPAEPGGGGDGTIGAGQGSESANPGQEPTTSGAPTTSPSGESGSPTCRPHDEPQPTITANGTASSRSLPPCPTQSHTATISPTIPTTPSENPSPTGGGGGGSPPDNHPEPSGGGAAPNSAENP